MTPITLSRGQPLHQISLLSPVSKPTMNGQYQQYHTVLTINAYSYEPAQCISAKTGHEQEQESSQNTNCYYHQDAFYSPSLPFIEDVSKLPPIPTYNESQMAYHPNGVKQLPHFHPQKFSKRLRSIMDERRRPRPLILQIEPQPKSYFSPCTTPYQTSDAPEAIIQHTLGDLPPEYHQAHHVEEGVVEYREEQSFWKSVDHQIIIIGAVGLVIMALALGAWAMALYTD